MNAPDRIMIRRNRRTYFVGALFALLLNATCPALMNVIPVTWLAVAVTRTAAASVVLLLFMLFTRNARAWCFQDTLMATCVGGLMFLHWTLFIQATKATVFDSGVAVSSPSAAAVGYSWFGLFAALFSGRTTRRTWISVSLAVLGSVVVLASSSTNAAVPKAFLYSMLSSVFYGGIVVLHERYDRVHWSKRAFGQFAGALVGFLLLTASHQFSPNYLPACSWKCTVSQYALLVLLLGFVCTAFSHSMIASSVDVLGASQVGVIGFFFAPFAIVASYFIAGEVPSLGFILGSFIVFLANAWQWLVFDVFSSVGNRPTL